MSDEQPAGKQKVRRVRAKVFSRVVGYYAPLDNWNDGKRQEFDERRTYDVPTAERLEQLGARQEGE